ncbi:ATP-binding protein [Streptomyces sp. NPDC002643]
MHLTTRSDSALTRAGSPAASAPALSITITEDKALVAEVRRSVREALMTWNAGEIADDMSVVTSELVSNALSHAEGKVSVRLWVDEGQALLEVDDGSTLWHAPRPVRREAESGRGLLLVAALASNWGWRLRGRSGKTVWASLALPAGRRA